MGLIHVLFAVLAFTAVQAATIPPALFSGLKYRMVGPLRGGRVTTVTGVASDPLTYYMGSTGGGVWKTTDAGNSWNNITDGYFAAASMGAVEVAPSDPNVIYAGTGSSKIRSNVSIGRGVYRSSDAGRTWRFVGLRDTGQISGIRVHPTNPDIVYVAAQGNPFAPSKERGVYRSTDGGKSWKLVLFVSDLAGAADIELQPGNPKVLFACMWYAQRKPWTIISGAHEGGIYKSSDGGNTWSKLAGGLPNELIGRCNISISAIKPERIYALIEAKPGSGLYRSEDAGATWKLVNGDKELTTRPFYYSTLGADPNNADTVYVGNENWFQSVDGGKTFRRRQVPHGDSHDLWINPRNSNYMIQANDGGANVSIDGGKSWSTQANQPTAEIYQLAVDNQYPYRLYGAQQDNTTVIVPSLAPENGQGFRNGPGCETGPIIPDPGDPSIVYGSCKGQFSRQDMRTDNEARYWIGAQSLYGNPGDDLIYRFQRVSPMEVSPFSPRTVYYGSQYVHRTRDGGVSWEKISPDLTARPAGTQGPSGEPITRDATGEEVYSTLYAIRESGVQRGVIWAGSNDGLLHITRDGGKTWTNVTPAGLPAGGRVQNIEPSPHRAGSAYVAIYRFLLGDFAPYIYRTDDFGKSWTKLTGGRNGIAADEPTRVVREDPARAGLLYAGTEFGLYVSFDNGSQWQSLQFNLPVTPVTDLRIAHHDLVAATQGRGFWILDNITALRQAGSVPAAKPFLYAPKDAVRSPLRAAQEGLGPASGGISYPRHGASIDFYLPAAMEVTLEILDAEGEVIRKFPVAGTAGMQRLVWDLRYPGPAGNRGRAEGGNGPVAVPGKYGVRMRSGSVAMVQPLTLNEDPRVLKSGVTLNDLREQFAHNLKVRELVDDVNRAVEKVKASQAKGDARANGFAERLITPSIRYSKPALQTHITYLYGMTVGTDQKIGRDAVERYLALRTELDAILVELGKL